MRVHPLFVRIAALASIFSAAPQNACEGGELAEPVRFDPRLYDIGSRWNCWPLPGESIEAHQHRLAIHLQTIQIAVEDDLAVVLERQGDRHA